MPTASNHDIFDELAAQVAELWVAQGVEGVTYSNVAHYTGRARGGIQHHFPTAEDMLRAAALHLVGQGLVEWGSIELCPEGVTPAALAQAEAWVWLCRHGGHPGPYPGTAEALADVT